MKAQEFDCSLLENGKFTMYEYAALKAYCIIVSNGYSTLKEYEEAWSEALKEITDKKSNITKGCPRKAFVGLCEDGYLKNIPAIPNKNSGFNKNYAIEAVNYLQNHKDEVEVIKASILWEKLSSNIDSETKARKCYNEQMHVILALWNKNLIVKKTIK